MKAREIFLIAGALLLLTKSPLASAFTMNGNVSFRKRYQTNGGPESKAYWSEASEGIASRTIRLAKRDPIIELKCVQSLNFAKKVGLECTKNEDCPDDSKCRVYHGSPHKFCLCSSTHVIYHKAEKLCMDINKPCERADLLQLCHSKAKCMSAGLGEGLFYCKCIPGYSGNGAVCKKIKKSKGEKKVKQVVDELRPTMYTPTKRKINKKPTGDNKGGEITVEELYTEAKNIVLRNKMLTAAGAAAVFIIIIVCYCCCRRRRRKQMRKKMQDAFEQQYFGQYHQAVDPGYGQRQSMMGGQLYDYPSPQVDNMTSQFAAPAPPAAPPPPPPPPGPKPAQATQGTAGKFD